MNTGFTLRLIEDRYAPHARLAVPHRALHRCVYAFAGSATVMAGHALATDEGFYARAAMPVIAGPEGAVIWRWELAPRETGIGLAEGDGIASRLVLDGAIETLDPAEPWLIRCDSVAFPPGGCALTHTHQGPGIRCLQQGGIRIDTGGASHRYEIGEAWFEDGPTPVFAEADPVPTRFVRVMVLPARLLGKSSISYVRPEDRDKPKDQTYRGYVDQPIER